MAFLARNLLFGQETTSAPSAEEEIAPPPRHPRRPALAGIGAHRLATPPSAKAPAFPGILAPPPSAPAIRGARFPAPTPSGATATRATPPPERAGHLDAPPPSAFSAWDAPLPKASTIRGVPHLGVLPPGAPASQRLRYPRRAASRRRRSPGHPLPNAAATRGTPLPGAIAPRRPSNTGSTPRSFPRCSPCRGRPGSPACRRCGTAGSRSAP